MSSRWSFRFRANFFRYSSAAHVKPPPFLPPFHFYNEQKVFILIFLKNNGNKIFSYFEIGIISGSGILAKSGKTPINHNWPKYPFKYNLKYVPLSHLSAVFTWSYFLLIHKLRTVQLVNCSDFCFNYIVITGVLTIALWKEWKWFSNYIFYKYH